jgi:hypothetical protein
MDKLVKVQKDRRVPHFSRSLREVGLFAGCVLRLR